MVTVGKVFLPSYSTEAQPSQPIHVFAIEQCMVNRLRSEIVVLEQRSSGWKRQRELDERTDVMKMPKLDEETNACLPESVVRHPLRILLSRTARIC